MSVVVHFVVFFKQKTAYEMRISDWSSDVCSSDLAAVAVAQVHAVRVGGEIVEQRGVGDRDAVRETGRSAAVLKIAGRVGLLLRQRRDGGGARLERAPVDGGDALRLGGLGRHGGDPGREEEHDRRSEEHKSELQSL